MFAVTFLILLHCWVRGFFIVFGVVRSVIPSCAGIAVFTMASFGAAPLTSVLWLLLGRFVLTYILFLLAIAFFGGIHHVNVI